MLHRDMTARDLLQQRATLKNGDTIWVNSPLATAALEGRCVMGYFSLSICDGLYLRYSFYYTQERFSFSISINVEIHSALLGYISFIFFLFASS
jgi:hypothetical protein